MSGVLKMVSLVADGLELIGGDDRETYEGRGVRRNI